MFSKKIIIPIVLIVLVALAGFGFAYAQEPETPQPPVGCGFCDNQTTGLQIRGRWQASDPQWNDPDAECPLHETMLAAFAEAFDIPVQDLQARVDSGETLGSIAADLGYTIDEFRELMLDIKQNVVEQALAEGLITQEQADWMKERGGFTSGEHFGRRGAFRFQDSAFGNFQGFGSHGRHGNQNNQSSR